MLIELLRLSGNPDLVRRWVAALMNVPADERESVVLAVEQHLASEFELPPAIAAASAANVPEFDIASAPSKRDGYTEVVVRTYAPAPKPKPAKAVKPKPTRKRASGDSAA